MHTTTKKESQVTNDAASAASITAIQPKLSIGAVNDPLEYEADAMADKVMSMQEVPVVASSGAGGIQRKCAGCEEKRIIHRHGSI
jgi:hypothetical protein